MDVYTKDGLATKRIVTQPRRVRAARAQIKKCYGAVDVSAIAQGDLVGLYWRPNGPSRCVGGARRKRRR